MMSKDETTERGGADQNRWARPCDSCRSAACTVYCRADSAYLCTTCDARIHTANRVASRHERVRVCESCENAPAAFLCKADAASLCPACDAEIHSANPLARRHQRLPILPISEGEADEDDDRQEADAWLLLNHGKNNTSNNNNFLFGASEADEYLDLTDYNSSIETQFGQDCGGNLQPQKRFGGDGVVPLQLGISYGSSSDPYNYSVSMDIGVVPESTTASEITGPPLQLMPQFSPMDREARVPFGHLARSFYTSCLNMWLCLMICRFHERRGLLHERLLCK